MSTTIIVTEVHPPAIGKKQGYVIDDQKRRWQVWGDKLHQFQVGGSYDITETKTTNFNGQQYVTIQSFNPLGQAQPQLPMAQPRTAAKPAPQPSMAVPQSDDVRRMDIFVCGAVNSMLSNQNVDPLNVEAGQMMMMIERYKDIWRRTLGPHAGPSAKPSPQQRGDMDDEIPF